MKTEKLIDTLAKTAYGLSGVSISLYIVYIILSRIPIDRAATLGLYLALLIMTTSVHFLFTRTSINNRNWLLSIETRLLSIEKKKQEDDEEIFDIADEAYKKAQAEEDND